MTSVSSGALGELATTMGMVVLDVGPDGVTAKLPVVGNRQPFGLLHGGANAVLAETIGSIHAYELAPAGHVPVGIELSCSHHRAAVDGWVTGRSAAVSHGRTLATLAIEIRDDSDRLVCTARLTCFYRAQPN